MDESRPGGDNGFHLLTKYSCSAYLAAKSPRSPFKMSPSRRLKWWLTQRPAALVNPSLGGAPFGKAARLITMACVFPTSHFPGHIPAGG